MNYTHDGNFLRCSHCGKYKVDTTEDFEVNYREDGTKEWLCEECNKYKSIFKGIAHGTSLTMIIGPGKRDDEFIVYNKDMYI
jgi:hypothetical protein